MRKIRLFLLLLSLFVIQATFAQFSISLNDVKLRPGTTETVHIAMNNTDHAIQTFNFTIKLPEGLSFTNQTSVLSWENGFDAPAGMLIQENFDGNDLIVLGYGMGNNIPVSTEQRNIWSFKVTADSKAKLTKDSQISLIDLSFGSPTKPDGYEISSVVNNLTIYDFFNVSVDANINMGTATVSHKENVESGTSITATAKANAGYEFVNWTDADNKEVSKENPYIFELAAETALTANFKAIDYDVTFDVDGNKTTASLPFGSEITAPETPKKTGYTFAGWNPEFKEGATVPVDGITYTATWTVNKYNYTFKRKYTDEDFTDPVVIEQTFGEAVVKPSDEQLKWVGHTFDKYESEIPANVTEEGEKVFVALYTINKHKVTFVNGDSKSEVELTYGDAIVLPELDERAGYTLSWDGYSEGMTLPDNDVTLTAKWTPIDYTITFDSKGGSEVEPITQGYETSVTAPADPTRTGYTFGGWEPAVPETMPLNGETCVAKWTINKYTLTFDLNGGESASIADITADYDSDVTVADPTRTGYTFKGWDPEFTGKIPAADTKYTAKWEVNKYNVTFNTDGGSVIDPIEVVFGSEITLPEAPTKEGYTFKGWQDVPQTMPAKDITLVASWTINQYKVTYMVDENNVYQEYTLDYGTDIQVPAKDPTKSGWVFLGWTSEYTGETVPAGDVVYTAQWKQDIIALRFVFWDGYYKEYKYKPGEEITEIPEVPAREGYTFKGWDKTIPEVMPEDVENGVLVITANWSVNKYVVYFIANGKTVKKQTMTYGSPIVAPEAPEVEGYTFVGWTPEVAETVPANNVWYEAVYEVNTYTVTYYVNGEVVNVAEVKYGEEIPAYEPTVEEGMKFDGWQEEIPAVMPATNLEIHGTTSGIETAIKNIVAKFGESFDVYNVSGRLVQRVNGASDITRIPAGMYIINGTKVVIRKD